MYCISIDIIFVYLLSPPPCLPIVDTIAAGATPLFDYFVDDRVPLPSSFQASSAPSPLPHIAYMSLLFCCTRHMLLLRYNPIQLHSLSLSPLVYLSDILCSLYKYIMQQWTLRFVSQ